MNVIPPYLKERCRRLRLNQTDAEALLWSLLRNRGLLGYKFRRQHSVGGCILDFYCHDARLALELDGGQHAEQVEKDSRRTRIIEKQGIKIVRYWNNEVLTNLGGVVEDTLRHIEKRSPSP